MSTYELHPFFIVHTGNILNNIRIYLKENGCRAWTGLIWLRWEEVSGSCECSYEPVRAIKCREFPQ